jgi:hypothetical protein
VISEAIEGQHLHYAGWVAGLMSYHGLEFEVVTDDQGNPTDVLKLTGGPDHITFNIVVPEPPDDWPRTPVF